MNQGPPPRTRNMFEWRKKDLVAVADMCAEGYGKRGRRRVLKFGDNEEDELPAYKSEKRAVLADCLSKFFKWSIARGNTRLVREWPSNLTPEKSVAKGAGGNTAAASDRREDFLVLLCCHLGNDSTFDGFIANFGKKDRHELEGQGNSDEAKWYRTVAADMINEDYMDDHGNDISFPVTHANDTPPAPDSLFQALDDIDLARTRRELHARFSDDTGPLEAAIRTWLKYLTSEHAVSTCLGMLGAWPLQWWREVFPKQSAPDRIRGNVVGMCYLSWRQAPPLSW